jgi:hypothetical protein
MDLYLLHYLIINQNNLIMKIRKFLVVAIAALSFSLISTQSANAQKEIKEKVTFSKDDSPSRGVDANIKVPKGKNTGETPEGSFQPKAKGGSDARGGYCEVVFDNWTSYYIDGYVNGRYEGYVGPWGSGSVWVSGGSTTVYGVAEFLDGSRYTWGPQTKSCNSQKWTFSMY